MARNKKQSKLLTLYNFPLLRNKVDKALDDGVAYDDILALCKEYDMTLSKSGLTRYSKKRKEAIKNGEDLGKLLNGDQKKAIQSIKNKEVNSVTAKETKLAENTKKAAKEAKDIEPEVRIGSTTELLEEFINKGRQALINDELPFKAKDVLSAIKMYDTLNGNSSSRGLTTEGLQQVRLLETATAQAMVEVIAEYVPEEKREEALAKLKQVQIDKYRSMDTSKQGKSILRALGVDFDKYDAKDYYED